MKGRIAVPVTLLGIEVVTSLGANEAAFAAMDVCMQNFVATHFHSGSEALIGAPIPWEPELSGIARQVELLVHVLRSLASRCGPLDFARTPIFLCLADDASPGQPKDAASTLALQIQARLDIAVHPNSRVIASGKCAMVRAVDLAQQMISSGKHSRIVVAAADGFLQRGTVRAALAGKRLVNQENGDGFIPGEAAGALLLGHGAAEDALLRLSGFGLSVEPATRLSDNTNHGAGLADAMRKALVMAGFAQRRRNLVDRELIETHLTKALATRMADVSGESFYFGEAATAAIRVFKTTSTASRFMVPAELVGETGAAVGLVMLGWCEFLKRRSTKPALPALLHFSEENGERAALVVEAPAGPVARPMSDSGEN